MAYSPYYNGGWKSGEVGATPITPEALNHMEDGIAAALIPSDVVNNLSSTATNKPLSAAQGRALNNVKADRYKYNGPICSASATSSGDVFSYYTDPPTGSYLCVLFRNGFTWTDAASVYFIEHGASTSFYGKTVIKEGSDGNCPKLDANGHIYLPAPSNSSISIFIMRLS